jgi:NAD(P)-dependent dehydrogenase (short-subunit alcohol dehydrogenase family)
METVLITGANRGIGLELTRQYLNKHTRVFAACPQSGDPTIAFRVEAIQSGNAANLSA